MHWCAMKVLRAFVMAVVLNTGAVVSLRAFPFKIREVSNNTFNDGLQPRIFGGMVAPESKFPFMIFVMMYLGERGMNQCSASLVQAEWVLLAAHCLNFPVLLPENIIAVGGRADLAAYVRARLEVDFHTPLGESFFGVQERRALKFYVNPKFNPTDFQHDVALIKLRMPFVLNSISVIALSENKMKERKACTILGWGFIAGNQQTYKLNFGYNKRVSTTSMGCREKAEGQFICLLPDSRQICQGDSGSPLVCDSKVWGVASHFVSNNEQPDCGDAIEEYYSEIYADLDWIRSTYNGGNLCSAVSLTSVFLYVFAGLLLSLKM